MNSQSAVGRIVKRVTIEPTVDLETAEVLPGQYTMRIKLNSTEYLMRTKLTDQQRDDLTFLEELARRGTGMFLTEVISGERDIPMRYWDAHIIARPLRRDLGFSTDVFAQTMRKSYKLIKSIIPPNLNERKMANLVEDAFAIAALEDQDLYRDCIVEESEDRFFGRRLYRNQGVRTYRAQGFKTADAWLEPSITARIGGPYESLGESDSLGGAKQLCTEWLGTLGLTEENEDSAFGIVVEEGAGGSYIQGNIYTVDHTSDLPKSRESKAVLRALIDTKLFRNTLELGKQPVLDPAPQAYCVADTKIQEYLAHGFLAAIDRTVLDIRNECDGHGGEDDQPDFLMKALPRYYVKNLNIDVVSQYLVTLSAVASRFFEDGIHLLTCPAEEVAVLHALRLAEEIVGLNEAIDDNEAGNALDGLRQVQEKYVSNPAIKIVCNAESYVPSQEEDEAIEIFLTYPGRWFTTESNTNTLANHYIAGTFLGSGKEQNLSDTREG